MKIFVFFFAVFNTRPRRNGNCAAGRRHWTWKSETIPAVPFYQPYAGRTAPRVQHNSVYDIMKYRIFTEAQTMIVWWGRPARLSSWSLYYTASRCPPLTPRTAKRARTKHNARRQCYTEAATVVKIRNRTRGIRINAGACCGGTIGRCRGRGCEPNDYYEDENQRRYCEHTTTIVNERLTTTTI